MKYFYIVGNLSITLDAHVLWLLLNCVSYHACNLLCLSKVHWYTRHLKLTKTNENTFILPMSISLVFEYYRILVYLKTCKHFFKSFLRLSSTYSYVNSTTFVHRQCLSIVIYVHIYCMSNIHFEYYWLYIHTGL